MRESETMHMGAFPGAAKNWAYRASVDIGQVSPPFASQAWLRINLIEHCYQEQQNDALVCSRSINIYTMREWIQE